jgi:23S rRNA pseudouridine1911/1915/1917 synthase
MIYDLELTSKIEPFMVGMGLLDYLYRRFDYRGVDFWRDKIEAGEVLVNGAPSHGGYELRGGDLVSYRVEDFYEEDLDCAYRVEYEDEHVVVVSKPANLPVQANKRFIYQTMTAILRRDLGLPDINPIHRLDRETSGLMVYLKSPFKMRPYRQHAIEILDKKLYLAVVRGALGAAQVQVDAPLREAKDGVINYRMLVSDDGKPASTVFYNLGQAGELSLVLCELLTGKKHQIRAHASHLGLPIVGDKLYYCDGYYFLLRCEDALTEEHLVELGGSCHMLHAYYLGFKEGLGLPRGLYSQGFSAEMGEYLARFEGWQERAQAVVAELYGEVDCE